MKNYESHTEEAKKLKTPLQSKVSEKYSAPNTDFNSRRYGNTPPDGLNTPIVNIDRSSMGQATQDFRSTTQRERSQDKLEKYQESVESKRVREARKEYNLVDLRDRGEFEKRRYQGRIHMGKTRKVSEVTRPSMRDVDTSKYNFKKNPASKIDTSAIPSKEQIEAEKAQNQQNLSVFGQNFVKILSSMDKLEQAKDKLFNMEGFSPNLIMSLITKSDSKQNFTFEEFREFLVEYLKFGKTVETKEIVDFFASFNQ